VVKHAGFRRDCSRHYLIQLIRKYDFVASSRLCFEAGNSRRHRRASLTDFAELRGKFSVFNSHQGLTLLNNGALLSVADHSRHGRHRRSPDRRKIGTGLSSKACAHLARRRLARALSLRLGLFKGIVQSSRSIFDRLFDIRRERSAS
jgi:hypothetical protein